MIKKILALFLLSVTAPSFAGLVVTGTRFVYPSDDKEISVNIENNGDKIALSQVWMTTGFAEKRSDKEVTKADIDETPFMVLPPLFKLKPNNVQTVRILYTGETLPADRESVFTLNVLDVPPKSKDVQNSLQLSVLSKFKLFYRPSAIAAEYGSAADKLAWKITREGNGVYLSAVNNSAFYITLDNATVVSGGTQYKVQSSFMMMAPFGGTTRAAITGLNSVPGAGTEIKFSYINDSGGSSDTAATLK